MAGPGMEALVTGLAGGDVVVDISACPGFLGHMLADASCPLALVAPVEVPSFGGRDRTTDEVSAAVIQHLSCVRGRQVEWFLVDPGVFWRDAVGPIAEVLRLAAEDGLVKRGGLVLRGAVAEFCEMWGSCGSVVSAVMTDAGQVVRPPWTGAIHLVRRSVGEAFGEGETPVYDVADAEVFHKLSTGASVLGKTCG